MVAMIVHDDPLCTLILGDCVEEMRELPAESVDAIVTDPPYDLLTTSRNGSRRINHPDTPAGRSARGFMGKTWDGTGVAFRPETWAECFRVAKPGAHLLAFGGTRTYHRLASAIEDAGWEIRDCLVWAYASGFPKSLDVSKAIDKAAGAEREVTGKSNRHIGGASWGPGRGAGDLVQTMDTAPATPDAARWDGWGTALKPAWEPIVMARKPLRGTVAANVLVHGTGALNIGATRIGTDAGWSYPNGAGGSEPHHMERGEPKGDGRDPMSSKAGRWPPNLLLSDPIFDGGVPGVVGGGSVGPSFRPGDRAVYSDDNRSAYGDYPDRTDGWSQKGAGYGDSGTYSRFFLIAKSSRSDREPIVYPDGHEKGKRFSTHPTQKPTELMRHLVRLVTPPGGTVLDCFLGSGTTAIAANAEGFRCIGIEREQEYLDIAVARLAHQPLGLGLDVAAPTRKRTTSGQQGPWTEAYSGYSQGWGRQRRPEDGSDKSPASRTTAAEGAGEDPAGYQDADEVPA